MPQPVIPVTHYELCIENYANETLRNKIISSLEPADETLFQYIIFFLREIVKNSATNGTSPEFLAELFSNAILRPEKHAQRKTDAKSIEFEKRKVCLFLRDFIKPEESPLI